MCNKLHKTSKQNWEKRFGNKTWGFGYKCFKVKNDNQLFPLCSDTEFSLDTWIKWDKKINDYDDGFCFFLTIKDVKKYISAYAICCKIRKIRYRKALGCHTEHVWDKRHLVSLCKEFKILEEVK